MNATMTSLPVVPSKFYQVCRLCLTVISDTSDLVNLSVFGRHNAGCTITNAQTNNANKNSIIVTASNTNSSSGVIVKANRKNEARSSSPTSEHSANNSVTSNASDDNNEAAVGDGSRTTNHRDGGNSDDDNNNFKIDGDLHHSDILERIHTFLSITVSGSF